MKKTITTTDILALWWKHDTGELNDQEVVEVLDGMLDHQLGDTEAARQLGYLRRAIDCQMRDDRLWCSVLQVWPWGFPPAIEKTPMVKQIINFDPMTGERLR